MKLTLSQKLLIILFLVVVFLCSWSQFRDSDGFYHIKTGELIWQTCQIPKVDVFSYTAYGKTWVTHEWLAQVLFYGIFSAFGFWGVIVFVSFLAALTYFILWCLAVRRGANNLLALLCLIVVGYFSFEIVWVPRPQVFSFFFVASLLFCLEHFDYKKENKFLWFSLGIICLWANMHASFPLGIGLIFFYAVLASKHRAFFMAGLGSILAGLLNPNTYHSLLYIFSIQQGVSTLDVFEWKSILRVLDYLNIKIYAIEILVLDLLFLWWFGIRKESRNLKWLILVLSFSIMPFISARYVAYWPLVALVPTALLITEVLKNRFDQNMVKVALWIIGAMILCTRIISVPKTYFTPNIPVYAADFIEANNLKGPFFNYYSDGGYFIFRFWPKEKVAIDGRSELFAGDSLKDFLSIVHWTSEAPRLVDQKYKINYFIIEYLDQGIVDSTKELSAKLTYNWPLVYWDDASLIYVRPSPENEDIIKKFGVYEVSPFRDPSSIPPNEKKAAVKELMSLIERAPQSVMLQRYASLVTSSN